MKTLELHRCFDGTLGYYRHDAASTQCPMRFTVYVPPQASEGKKLPALVFLSGLTCTEDNFTIKAGAYRMASELGLIVVVPDTSPRGEGVPTGDASDLGFGAGFYINATQAPWKTNYQMETYIAQEFHALIQKEFPIDGSRIGLCGHSMGGHGALTLFQKYPGQYQSLSALAPICSPTQSPWGQKVFANYLGDDASAWEAHDATLLLRKSGKLPVPILIDQGTSDPFIERLRPDLFEKACAEVGQPLILRRQDGYDHGYFFIQSFIDDHLLHHAAQLTK